MQLIVQIQGGCSPSELRAASNKRLPSPTVQALSCACGLASLPASLA